MLVNVWESGGGEEVDEDAIMGCWVILFDLGWVSLCRRVGSVASSPHCNGMVDNTFQKSRERRDISRRAELVLYSITSTADSRYVNLSCKQVDVLDIFYGAEHDFLIRSIEPLLMIVFTLAAVGGKFRRICNNNYWT